MNKSFIPVLALASSLLGACAQAPLIPSSSTAAVATASAASASDEASPDRAVGVCIVKIDSIGLNNKVIALSGQLLADPSVAFDIGAIKGALVGMGKTPNASPAAYSAYATSGALSALGQVTGDKSTLGGQISDAINPTYLTTVATKVKDPASLALLLDATLSAQLGIAAAQDQANALNAQVQAAIDKLDALVKKSPTSYQLEQASPIALSADALAQLATTSQLAASDGQAGSLPSPALRTLGVSAVILQKSGGYALHTDALTKLQAALMTNKQDYTKCIVAYATIAAFDQIGIGMPPALASINAKQAVAPVVSSWAVGPRTAQAVALANSFNTSKCF